MIKIEICECIRPYHRLFEKGKKYMVINIKNSYHKAAYASLYTGIPITDKMYSYTSNPYYQLFFKPLVTLYVKNYKELNEFKKNVFTILKPFAKNGGDGRSVLDESHFNLEVIE